jgi:hypothetical protein
MSIRKIEIERFSVITSKPFDAVVTALKAFAELEEVINRDMGKTHLMLFLEFDHGAVLRKETGSKKLRWCGS